MQYTQGVANEPNIIPRVGGWENKSNGSVNGVVAEANGAVHHCYHQTILMSGRQRGDTGRNPQAGGPFPFDDVNTN